MSIEIATDNVSAEGKVVANAGTVPARTVGSTLSHPAERATATGRIVLASDHKTLEFLPDDSGAFAAVVSANS